MTKLQRLFIALYDTVREITHVSCVAAEKDTSILSAISMQAKKLCTTGYMQIAKNAASVNS